MSKPFALQTVLDLMQRRTDDATLQLARLIAAEQDAKAKLDLLCQYREEYAQRFQVSAQQGLSPMQWKNFQDFLGRLDDAIAQQQQVVGQTRTRTSAGQAHWQAQRVRLQAMNTLSVRHHTAEALKEGRREQKVSDEHAARRKVDSDD